MKQENITSKMGIPRKRAMKYVEYLQKQCVVHESIKESFWKAVIMLCENPDSHINELGIDEEQLICTRTIPSALQNGINISSRYTPMELAQQIIENETSPIDKLDLMIIKDKVLELENRMKRYY